MNKQEIQNKINELEKQLTELKEELNNPESKVFKPEYGEIYYYIYSVGVIDYDDWLDTAVNISRYAIGNCFATSEEAEFEIERLKVITELKRFAEGHNEPIDWNDRQTVVHYIAYDYLDKEVCIYFTLDVKSNDIYFSSKEIANQAVKEISEDRIKKYYLMVE